MCNKTACRVAWKRRGLLSSHIFKKRKLVCQKPCIPQCCSTVQGFDSKEREVGRLMAQLVRPLLVTRASHAGIPAQVPAALLPILLPANVPGKQQRTARAFGSLTLTWETWMECLALGFGLSQPCCWRHLGNEPLYGKISLAHSLSFSVTLPFKKEKKNCFKKEKEGPALWYSG